MSSSGSEVCIGLRTSKRSQIIINTVFILFCLFCVFPLVLLLSISLSTENDIINNGFKIIPMHLTTEAYKMIFESPMKILNAFKVTALVTIIGTLVGLVITSMLAYSLSRSNFKFGRPISFFLFFTMLFSGGLVPYYILMTKYLHLTDTMIALLVPNLFNSFNAFLMRTNFQKLPQGLVESAKIDGASEFRIYAQIVMPLSTPTIATVGLFIALGAWNDWMTALLFINNTKMYPLQMLLQMMMANLQSVTNDMNSLFAQELMKSRKLPAETLRMAMCLITIGPILVLFPFLQKYFVKGLTVGSVKG
jgi:putative aldouronate transport system permease protein